MSVNRTCNPGNGAVDLAVSAGEYLEYRIPSADANVQYVLAERGGGSLFDNASCPPPCTHRWPPEGTDPGRERARHTLSMQFFASESLSYEVERKDSGGSVLEVVKVCSFQNSGGPDEFFEPLTISLS